MLTIAAALQAVDFGRRLVDAVEGALKIWVGELRGREQRSLQLNYNPLMRSFDHGPHDRRRLKWLPQGASRTVHFGSS